MGGTGHKYLSTLNKNLLNSIKRNEDRNLTITLKVITVTVFHIHPHTFIGVIYTCGIFLSHVS